MTRPVRQRLTTIVVISILNGWPAVHAAQDPAKAGVLLDQADGLRARRDRVPLEQSLDAYRAVIATAEHDHLEAIAARARLGSGLALNLLGLNADAVPFLEAARQSFQQSGDRAHEAEALIVIAGGKPNPKDGLAAARQALALARESGDKRIEAFALDTFGWSMKSAVEPAEVRSAFERAIALYAEIGDDVGRADAIAGLGWFLSDQPNSDSGSESAHYQQALDLARAAGDARETGLALSLLGWARSRANDNVQAMAYYEESLPFSRRAGDRIQLGYSLDGIGRVLYSSGRLRRALEIFKEVADVRRQLKDLAAEGYALNNIGVVLQQLGQSSEAESFLNQALTIHRQTGKKAEEAKTLIAIANLRLAANDALGALALAQQALASAREAREPGAEWGAYSWVGIANTVLGRYHEAIEAFEASIQQAVAAKDIHGQGQGERWLARVYRLLGNSQAALVHADRAISVAEGGTNQGPDLLAALSIAAAVRVDLGDFAAAERLVHRAQNLEPTVEFPQAISVVEESAATLALAKGDARGAIRAIDRELGEKRRGNDSGTAAALTQAGRAYMMIGNRSRALSNYQRALATPDAAENPATRAVTLTALMEYWRGERRPEVAAFFGKQAINLFQQTRANLLQMDPGLQRAYVDSRAGIYRELADILIGAGRLLEAQQILDMLKEQEYLDFVRRDASDGPSGKRAASATAAEAASAARYQEIQDRIVQLGRARSELVRNTRRTPEEDQRLAAIENDLAVANAAFLRTLDDITTELGRDRAARDRTRAIEDEQPLMDKLRELGKGTVAVYAVVTPSKIHLLLVTADVRKAADFTIRQEDLNHRIEAFRSALQNPRVDPRPLGREFYEMLVAPIAKDLERAEAKTILWSLDDRLRYIPMAALFDGESYLVERYRSVLYTAAGRSTLADSRRTMWTALGVGVSQATAGFSPLPAVTHELQSIIRSPQGGGLLDGEILLNDRFTKDAFLADLRHQTPVVHIASHFQLNPGDDNDSFLLMGDGSEMTLREVRNAGDLFRDIDLLTLSACSTGLASSHADGTEIEGLGVLAERQGAKAVVAGLWSVADTSTSEFMLDFYRGMVRDADDKAEALRQSQLTLLYGSGPHTAGAPPAARPVSARGVRLVSKTDAAPFVPPPGAPWAHPYFWAPFILIGNPR